MTYSTEEERIIASKARKKLLNKQYYEKLKTNPVAYRERLQEANIQATERANIIAEQKYFCVYCGYCVGSVRTHQATKHHKDNVIIMESF